MEARRRGEAGSAEEGESRIEPRPVPQRGHDVQISQSLSIVPHHAVVFRSTTRLCIRLQLIFTPTPSPSGSTAPTALVMPIENAVWQAAGVADATPTSPVPQQHFALSSLLATLLAR